MTAADAGMACFGGSAEPNRVLLNALLGVLLGVLNRVLLNALRIVPNRVLLNALRIADNIPPGGI